MNRNEKLFTIAYFVAFGFGLGLALDFTFEVMAQEAKNGRTNVYEINYQSIEDKKRIILNEELNGCEKVSVDYLNKDGTKGIITFSCDRLPDNVDPPEPNLQAIQGQLNALENRVNALENRVNALENRP